MPYLGELMEGVPSSANVEYYAEIVYEHSVRRTLVRAGDKLDKKARLDSVDPDELRATVQHWLEMGRQEDIKPAPKAAEALPGVTEVIEAWVQGDDVGTKTGIRSLDYRIGALFPGTFAILAGEPRDGKTAFASQVSVNVASRGESVLFFSAEMSREMLTLNMLSILSQVEWAKLRRREGFNQSELTAWGRARKKYQTLPLFIDDTPSISVESLASKAKLTAKREELSLVVVDYVQLCTTERGGKRHERLAEISRRLKSLARELDTPLLALSQITRSEDGRPLLRGSRNLHAEGDYVMLLGRKKKFQWGSKEAEPDVAERSLKLEKNKFGGSYVLGYDFHKPTLTFREKKDGDSFDSDGKSADHHDPETQDDGPDGRQGSGGAGSRAQTEGQSEENRGGRSRQTRLDGAEPTGVDDMVSRDVPDDEEPF